MRAYVASRVKTSLQVFWQLVRIMVPVMVAVKVAADLGLVDALGPVLAPVMMLVDLPPEAGLVWIATLAIGVYGGLGALPLLADSALTAGQLSTICAMMLFAHALPVEQAIARKAGASFWFTALLRFGAAVLYGVAVAAICKATGWLSEPVDAGLLRRMASPSAGPIDWLISSALSLAATFVIIVALIVLLDLFEKTGITRRLTAAMMPLLRFSGLSRDMAPVTTVGVLLGLTYGGGLIIKEAQERNFEPKMRVLALCWISLSHSLIEDTGLMLAVGADIWVVLVGRIILTLLLMKLIALILDAAPTMVRRLAT